jgi:hypothetical protein
MLSAYALDQPISAQEPLAHPHQPLSAHAERLSDHRSSNYVVTHLHMVDKCVSVVSVINLIKPNIGVVLENHRVSDRTELPHRIMDALSRDTIWEVVTLADTKVWNVLNNQTHIGTQELLLDKLGESLSHLGDTLECLGSPSASHKDVLGSL